MSPFRRNTFPDHPFLGRFGVSYSTLLPCAQVSQRKNGQAQIRKIPLIPPPVPDGHFSFFYEEGALFAALFILFPPNIWATFKAIS